MKRKEQKRIRALQKFNDKKKYGIPEKFLVRGIPKNHQQSDTICNGTATW